jgi:hypothetical protein
MYVYIGWQEGKAERKAQEGQVKQRPIKRIKVGVRREEDRTGKVSLED